MPRLRIQALRTEKLRKMMQPKKDLFKHMISKDPMIPKPLRDKYRKNDGVYASKIIYPCVLSGRNRAVMVKKWKMNRILFRQLGSKGYLPGVKKARW